MDNDLISRSELKKAIKSYADDQYAENEYLGECAIMNIIDNAPTVKFSLLPADESKDEAYMRGYEKGKIEGLLSERQADGWIPFSDRLPDKNMHCLVSVGIFNFTQIAMYSDLMGTINHKIFWQGDYGKNNFQNITEYVNAWQPLPEPYKKGGVV